MAILLEVTKAILLGTILACLFCLSDYYQRWYEDVVEEIAREQAERKERGEDGYN